MKKVYFLFCTRK